MFQMIGLCVLYIGLLKLKKLRLIQFYYFKYFISRVFIFVSGKIIYRRNKHLILISNLILVVSVFKLKVSALSILSV